MPPSDGRSMRPSPTETVPPIATPQPTSAREPEGTGRRTAVGGWSPSEVTTGSTSSPPVQRTER